MRLSLQPFPCCAVVSVSLTPLGYVLLVGKLYDQVPRVVPEGNTVVPVYVDLSEIDPIEGMGLMKINLAEIERKAAEWLISPMFLN